MIKLTIRILNGIRAQKSIDLYEIENQSTEYILENESLEIYFLSSIKSDEVKLNIFELSIDYNERLEKGNEYLYIWKPRYKNYYLFHNYFGYTTLSISFDDDNIYEFQPIEIYTTKANADNMKDMLAFLVKENNEDIFSSYRLTQAKFSRKNGIISPSELLDILEKLIPYIEKVLLIFKNHRLYRLIQKEELIDCSSSQMLIDDNTIAWITQNLDQVYETDEYDDKALLKYDNRYYGLDRLNASITIKDYNIYENKIIIGFLEHLIITIDGALKSFPFSLKNKDINNYDKQGYVSFIQYLKYNGYYLNEQYLNKLNSFKKRITNIQFHIKKYLIGVDSLRSAPLVTSKVKNNIIYFRLFKEIISWYHCGRVVWGHDYLASLKNASELFEFYCLFKLNNCLKSILNSNGLPRNFSKNRQTLGFVYDYNNSIFISLRYQPQFWMLGHASASLEDLNNIEGYSVYNNKISRRSNVGSKTKRTPDFVISIENGEKTYDLIIDAKYTSTENMFIRELPKLVLKYLHGLHHEKHQIIGLMLLNYGNDCQLLDYYCDEFSLMKYKEKPILPYILAQTISENIVDSVYDLDKVISRILECSIGLTKLTQPKLVSV